MAKIKIDQLAADRQISYALNRQYRRRHSPARAGLFDLGERRAALG
jgi:hypothetical protein